MRRIRLVLAVLMMMMVLLATTAAPAMAWGRDGCCFRDRDNFRVFNNCCVNRGFFNPVFSTFGCFTGLGFGCGLTNGLNGFNTGFNTGGLVINNGNVF